MSLDPQTLQQIEALAHKGGITDGRDGRPLLVLDVDDVLLHFVGPLLRYFETQGARLQLSTFRLFGNVFDISTGAALDNERVREMLDSFFDAQGDWQTPVDGASEAIAKIARHAEIVMLTAMPHRHRDTRRVHLDRIGLPYPLLTIEQAKGPAIRHLRGQTSRAVAFVDDMTHNLVSARREVADSHLFHLMADNSFRTLIPAPPEDVTIVMDWNEASERIATALDI